MDANVLLLLVVGRAARGFVSRHKRLEHYSEADFDLLVELMASAVAVGTTPNVWTEVSNIAEFGVPASLRDRIIWQIKTQIEQLIEVYVESNQSVQDYAFRPLGLTDTTLLLALDKETTLLTADAGLYEQARSRGHRVVNFHHVREERGLI